MDYTNIAEDRTKTEVNCKFSCTVTVFVAGKSFGSLPVIHTLELNRTGKNSTKRSHAIETLW